MNQKPSERIEQIRQGLLDSKNIKPKERYSETYIISALFKYLDEEYEKKLDLEWPYVEPRPRSK